MSFNSQAYLKSLGKMSGEDIDLARAALALAHVRQPDVNPERCFNHLNKLCEQTQARHTELLMAGADDDVNTMLAALKYVIADEHGYHGDEERPDDLDNASLIRVIDRGQGMPITLSIIYIHVAHSFGWDVAGLDMPGHFLCRLEKDGIRVIFDPSTGCKKLEAADLRALIKKAKGPQAELTAAYYEPVDNRQILIRLQNIIKLKQIEMEEYVAALETVEIMREIDPTEYRLLLDAGVLYARTQKPQAAIDVLEEYIKRAPQARDREDAAILLREIKETLS